MPAKETTAVYATWTRPGTEFAVSYSLPLFHEIDFVVNDGYRRIPHGGIEVGGLLFGRFENNSVRLDAFRSIECEHASGPSFVLSERDLASLGQQLASAASDPELEGLQVVGWFIAHTRSELGMNEHEAALFDELFPGPGKMTVLIKPERFQPTRFAFLVRESDGRVDQDGTQHAIILPLPERADSGVGPDAIPFSAAPPEERPTPDGALFRGEERRHEEMPASPTQSVPEALPESFVASEPKRGVPVEPTQAAGEMPSWDRTNTMSHRLSMAISRAPALPEVPAEQPRKTVETPPDAFTEALVRTRTFPPLEEIRGTRPLELQRRALDPHDAQYQMRPAKESHKRSSLRLASALLIAAMLGSALGYWTYQRISPSAIPLTIEPQPSTLLVSWPVEETRDAGFAALKIDDGSAIPLTEEQKAAGEAEISVADDNLKVELIVRHRIGDAHGIVRYVRAAQGQTPQNP